MASARYTKYSTGEKEQGRQAQRPSNWFVSDSPRRTVSALTTDCVPLRDQGQSFVGQPSTVDANGVGFDSNREGVAISTPTHPISKINEVIQGPSRH